MFIGVLILGIIVGVVFTITISKLIISNDAYENKELEEKDTVFNNCLHYDKSNGVCKCFSSFNGNTPNIAYCSKGPCSCYQSKGKQITIETQYDIGDEVWFADYVYDTYYPCRCSGTVYEIDVEITESQLMINYWLKIDYDNHILYEKYAEKACFASYKECKQWCKEYNN